MLSGSLLCAQELPKSIPISVSYFSFAAIRPGIKVGTQLNMRQWQTEQDTAKINKSFYISPQFGIYSWPNVYTSTLLNAEFGYKRQQVGKKSHWALGAGLGYLRQSDIQSLVVNLGSGDTDDKIRETTGYFLPSVSGQFGSRLNNKMDWFTKITSGIRLAPDTESAFALFAEFGITYHIKKSQTN